VSSMAGISSYLDVIVEPRYDTVLLPAGGAQLLTFFALPKGQGVGIFQPNAGAFAKSAADTNMDLAGSLPGGYNFKLLGFRVMYGWNMATQDLQTVINGAVFTLLIGSKPFLSVPLRTIPAGNGPMSTAAGVNTNGWPMLSNSYSIAKKPLDLLQTQNFQVTLTWPGGVVAPVTVGATCQQAPGLPVTVFLDGYLYRPVQ
jgi:hypothetical protein